MRGKFFFFLLVLWAFPCEAADAPRSLDVVVLYDAEYRFAEPQPTLVSLREFLGHFNARQRTVQLDEWTPGALSGADIVFVLGLEERAFGRDLLAELASAPKVAWLEANVEQIAHHLGWSDFVFEGRRSGWSSVSYRSLRRSMADWIRCYITRPGEGAETFSTIGDGFDEKPLAWRRGNIHYIGAVDFYEPYAMAAFVDFLYRVFPPGSAIDIAPPNSAMARIEDVSPLVRADAVRGVIEAVESHGIPYAIGVIPIGVAEKQQLTLRDNPELLTLLQRAQANGASIIMHGYTHQNEFSPKTGEGWEFWNATDDRPMDDDEAFTRDRIEKSFVELARNGLYPIAFEPPHYAMSKKGYEVLSGYFEIFSGMPQISDASDTISLTLPFVVRSPHLNGMTILPENMGYYDGDENTAEMMLQNAQQLLDVQGAFACFFYHGYIAPDKVHAVIEGVERMGYTFFDMRSLPVTAGSSRVKIAVSGGELTTWVAPALLEEWRIEGEKRPKGIVVQRVARVQVLVLVAVVLVFLALIVRLRRNAGKKYEVQ